MADANFSIKYLHIIKPKIARKLGMRRYFTGKSCPRGHTAERYTSHGKCVMCAREDIQTEKRKEYDRQYAKRNSEAIKLKRRDYFRRNRHLFAEASKEWVKKNPEKRKAISENYKHRRRAAEEGGISTTDLMLWKRSQKKVCYWCGKPCKKLFHVDHYVPLSKGGEHSESNLVIACQACNLRKSAQDPYEFAAQVGRLF